MTDITPTIPETQAPLKPKNIRKEHREHLYTSGLTDATIDKALIATVDNADVVHQLIGVDAGHGIMFFKMGKDGKRVPFQFRPDKPFESYDGKKRKYITPAGQHPGVYFPPTVNAGYWSDASKPIAITEGAKKALKLSQEGVPCIALAGVWMAHNAAYKRTSGLWRLAPDLIKLPWMGRSVTIYFDSDVVTKKEVEAAEKKLVLMLTTAGAIVHVARIPQAVGQAKDGIDDYLTKAVDCKAALEGIPKLTAAEVLKFDPAENAAALKLNDRFAYVADQDKVYDMKLGVWISLRGLSKTNIIGADIWTDDPFRMERTSFLTSSFAPGADIGEQTLNLFIPDRMIQYNGAIILAEPCPPQVWTLVKNLANDDEKIANRILDKAAFILQHPGKALTGTVLQDTGTGGTGKTTWLSLLTAITQPYSQTLSHRQMKGNFNQFLATNILVVIPEVKSEEDQKELEHQLREYVLAGAGFTLNQKFQQEKAAIAYAAWWCSTNYEIAFNIPGYDRRWEVFRSDLKLDPGLGKFLTEASFDPKHPILQQLVNHLSERDLSKFNPMEVVDTEAKREMVQAGKTGQEIMWDIIQSPEGFLSPGTITTNGMYILCKAWLETNGYRAPAKNTWGRGIPKAWRGWKDHTKKVLAVLIPDFGQTTDGMTGDLMPGFLPELGMRMAVVPSVEKGAIRAEAPLQAIKPAILARADGTDGTSTKLVGNNNKSNSSIGLKTLPSAVLTIRDLTPDPIRKDLANGTHYVLGGQWFPIRQEHARLVNLGWSPERLSQLVRTKD